MDVDSGCMREYMTVCLNIYAYIWFSMAECLRGQTEYLPHPCGNPNLETNAYLKKIINAQKQRALQLDGKDADLTNLFVTEAGKKDRALRICDRVTANLASHK